MSSVIVKGMDMPTECEYCGFCRFYRDNGSVWCNARNRVLMMHWEEPDWVHLDVRKPDWCPLAEVKTPHGELIDRNVLWDAMSKYNDNEGAKMPFGDDDSMIHRDSACFMIESADTIIEAEDET